MIEFLFQLIAVIAYMLCGIRIVCFNRNDTDFHRGYSFLATLLIASLWDKLSISYSLKIQSHCGMRYLQSFWLF